jgi:sugar phosphate isomerase/epimerase
MVVEGHLDPVFALAILGPLLKHVHAKNKAYVREDGHWTTAAAPIDAGYVDWVKVFRALAEAKYDGWVSIDHLSGETTAATFRKDIAALRHALDASMAPVTTVDR